MKQKLIISIAAFLFGVGLACGALPLIAASLLIKKNLLIETIDRMDGFWKELLSSRT